MFNRNISWWRALDSTYTPSFEGEWIPSPSAGRIGPLMWHVFPKGLSAHIWATAKEESRESQSGRFVSPDFGEVEWTLINPTNTPARGSPPPPPLRLTPPRTWNHQNVKGNARNDGNQNVQNLGEDEGENQQQKK